ncbi:MAG: NUDIX domain-containing protein [Pirellulales bacterium]
MPGTAIGPNSPSPVRLGVVGVICRQDRLLVIRRSALVTAPRAFCFPGGGIEAGESEPQALIRELHEELGVAATPLRKIWSSITPWNVALSWWRATIADTALLQPQAAEVESCHWHTVAEMAANPDLLDSNRRFLQALHRGEFTL